jgi:prepilin-type processing-associated H-X9-DG protein
MQMTSVLIAPSSYQVCGNSYRFNWALPYNYISPKVAEDPYYNLSGKKENWPPLPSQFIMMHEIPSYPWNDGSDTGGTVNVGQWHYSAHPGKMFSPATLKTDSDKFQAPVLFVDGHARQCDFTRIFQANPLRALEPGPDWIWYKPVSP